MPAAVVAAGVAAAIVPVAGGPIRYIAVEEAHIAARGIDMFWARAGAMSMNAMSKGFEETLIQRAIQWVEQNPFGTLAVFRR